MHFVFLAFDLCVRNVYIHKSMELHFDSSVYSKISSITSLNMSILETLKEFVVIYSQCFRTKHSLGTTGIFASSTLKLLKMQYGNHRNFGLFCGDFLHCYPENFELCTAIHT